MIAVLAGGISCEREVSLVSGKAVFDALVSSGREAVMIDPKNEDWIEQLKKCGATFAFIALHGTFGEDGTVQSILEKEGIDYSGPGPDASRRAFDKSKAQTIFKEHGIRVPEFQLLKKNSIVDVPPAERFPLVVKPATSGSSVGISILKEPSGYLKAVEEAFKYSEILLIEKYIPGRELTVGVLGGQALPVVEITAKRAFYDYQAKYQDTGTVYEVPARLSAEQVTNLQEIALKACSALDCERLARVDFILTQNEEAFVLEANTIPGLTGKSLLPKAAKAAGLDFPHLCARIIELSQSTRQAKSGKTG